MAGMPCAQMMAGALVVDTDQPGLCFQHCHASADASQPLDPSQLATLQAPAIVQMFFLPPLLLSTPGAPSWAAHDRERERAPPEPHSIHHCCWQL